MALVAAVENGQIVESASQSSLSKTSTTSAASSDMDKDAFLQLLVAQMKYQDPLEPTSNTEYISQYAQFSQVESLSNMSANLDLQRASGLVGEQVYVKTTSSTGESKYIQGKVDYVVYENNKAYLAINEELYALEDLDTVADAEYMAAYDKAYAFVAKHNRLPVLNGVDITDADEIDALEEEYNAMSDYEKSFIASDVVESLNKYIEKLKEVRLAAENDNTEKPEDNGNTEGAGNTEGSEGSDN